MKHRSAAELQQAARQERKYNYVVGDVDVPVIRGWNDVEGEGNGNGYQQQYLQSKTQNNTQNNTQRNTQNNTQRRTQRRTNEATQRNTRPPPPPQQHAMSRVLTYNDSPQQHYAQQVMMVSHAQSAMSPTPFSQQKRPPNVSAASPPGTSSAREKTNAARAPAALVGGPSAYAQRKEAGAFDFVSDLLGSEKKK